ncbi:MAG: hypothetical protein ACT4P7_11490 [Gemmatimonadaceae bacterium]
MRDQLFVTARSAQFRPLRAEYRRTDGVVPPDGGSPTLTITAGERTHTVAGERNVAIPQILQRYACWMSVGRGLILLACD